MSEDYFGQRDALSKATNRRQQGQQLKRIVAQVTGRRVSVRSGRGTAHAWWYVVMDRLDENERSAIMARAKRAGLLGHYFSDSGPRDDWEPCVFFHTTNGRRGAHHARHE